MVNVYYYIVRSLVGDQNSNECIDRILYSAQFTSEYIQSPGNILPMMRIDVVYWLHFTALQCAHSIY